MAEIRWDMEEIPDMLTYAEGLLILERFEQSQLDDPHVADGWQGRDLLAALLKGWAQERNDRGGDHG